MPQVKNVRGVARNGLRQAAVDRLISQQSPGVSIEGIDALVRSDARIPVRPFDGIHVPYPDASFDVVMFVDVLITAMFPSCCSRKHSASAS
jgi:hypothetical protein